MAITTFPRPQSHSHSTPYTVSRLHLDWQRLAVDRRAISRAKAWQLPLDHVLGSEELSSLDDVLRGLGMDGAPAAAQYRRHDECCVRLIALARTDELAGRVMMQRMLPGLSAVARRRRAQGSGRLEALDELLGVAWTVIREYDLDREARHVLMRLVGDCEYRVFRSSGRRLLVSQPTAPADFDRSNDRGFDCGGLGGGRSATEHRRVEPLEELMDVLRDALDSGLSRDDASFVWQLACDKDMNATARRLHVTERTIRNRRDVVVERLRQALAA